jgi:hypothetical protein
MSSPNILKAPDRASPHARNLGRRMLAAVGITAAVAVPSAVVLNKLSDGTNGQTSSQALHQAQTEIQPGSPADQFNKAGDDLAKAEMGATPAPVVEDPGVDQTK